MYKVAILGCENSHADSFLSLIKDGLYPDLEVVGVYSHEEEPPKKLQEKYGQDLKCQIVAVNPTAGSHCGPDTVGVAFHAIHR